MAMLMYRRKYDGRRGHSSAKMIAWWLAAMAAMFVLALAEAITQHTVILVVLSAAAACAMYGLGRVHGGRRMAGRTIAAELRLDAARRSAAERERLIAELEQLASRSLGEIVESYRVIQGKYTKPGGRP